MGHSYDQEWPIEPRGPKFRQLWRWSPDDTTSDALQTWSEMARIPFYLLIQVTSTLLITLYDPSHSGAQEIPQPLHILGQDIPVPDFIRDLAPEAFMLACLAYAFSAAALYRLRPNDQYQQRFLLLAVCVATFLCFASSQDMRSWLSPTITAALVLSLFAHSVFPSLRADAFRDADEAAYISDGPLCQEKQPETTSRC